MPFDRVINSSSIGHVRYINIRAWLRGFRVKIANFSSFLCPSIPKRELDTKKTTPNIEVWPESLGAMLEYWYIERGLLPVHSIFVAWAGGLLPGEGEGEKGTQQSSMLGGFEPRSKILPFSTQFWKNDTPFVYLKLKKGSPFTSFRSLLKWLITVLKKYTSTLFFLSLYTVRSSYHCQ